METKDRPKRHKQLTRDDAIFAVRVPLGLGQMCYGYSMTMTIICFDDEQICALGCFQHRNLAYRVPMSPMDGATALQTVEAITRQPGMAAESILRQFVNLSPEEREEVHLPETP